MGNARRAESQREGICKETELILCRNERNVLRERLINLVRWYPQQTLATFRLCVNTVRPRKAQTAIKARKSLALHVNQRQKTMCLDSLSALAGETRPLSDSQWSHAARKSRNRRPAGESGVISGSSATAPPSRSAAAPTCAHRCSAS